MVGTPPHEIQFYYQQAREALKKGVEFKESPPEESRFNSNHRDVYLTIHGVPPGEAKFWAVMEFSLKELKGQFKNGKMEPAFFKTYQDSLRPAWKKEDLIGESDWLSHLKDYIERVMEADSGGVVLPPSLEPENADEPWKALPLLDPPSQVLVKVAFRMGTSMKHYDKEDLERIMGLPAEGILHMTGPIALAVHTQKPMGEVRNEFHPDHRDLHAAEVLNIHATHFLFGGFLKYSLGELEADSAPAIVKKIIPELLSCLRPLNKILVKLHIGEYFGLDHNYSDKEIWEFFKEQKHGDTRLKYPTPKSIRTVLEKAKILIEKPGRPKIRIPVDTQNNDIHLIVKLNIPLVYRFYPRTSEHTEDSQIFEELVWTDREILDANTYRGTLTKKFVVEVASRLEKEAKGKWALDWVQTFLIEDDTRGPQDEPDLDDLPPESTPSFFGKDPMEPLLRGFLDDYKEDIHDNAGKLHHRIGSFRLPPEYDPRWKSLNSAKIAASIKTLLIRGSRSYDDNDIKELAGYLNELIKFDEDLFEFLLPYDYLIPFNEETKYLNDTLDEVLRNHFGAGKVPPFEINLVQYYSNIEDLWFVQTKVERVNNRLKRRKILWISQHTLDSLSTDAYASFRNTPGLDLQPIAKVTAQAKKWVVSLGFLHEIGEDIIGLTHQQLEAAGAAPPDPAKPPLRLNHVVYKMLFEAQRGPSTATWINAFTNIKYPQGVGGSPIWYKFSRSIIPPNSFSLSRSELPKWILNSWSSRRTPFSVKSRSLCWESNRVNSSADSLNATPFLKASRA